MCSVIPGKSRKGRMLIWRIMRYLLVVAIASAFLGGSLAWAQGEGPGKKPPGWQKGEKKGWEGDAPPGLEKKGGMPPGLKKKQGPKAAGQEKKKEKAASRDKEKDKKKETHRKEAKKK